MLAPHREISIAGLRARLNRLGSDGLGEDHGDHILNPDLDAFMQQDGAREAAVLVPIVDADPEPLVILTTRAVNLRKHSGQIAFPGGAIDPGDPSPEAAALRESFEEIGLDPGFVEIVGRLPRYRTTTGFRITPVVGLVRPGFALAPHPDEVADVFEVPLAFLMDGANHVRRSGVFAGRERLYYEMPFGERFIWGVTAGIIRTLYERLGPS